MNQIPAFFSNKFITKAMIYGNIITTILAVVLFFTGTGEVFALLGCHIPVYPVLGLAIAAAMQSLLLVGVCLIYCGIGMTALAVGWYSAIRNSNYKTLLIVSATDVVFSLFILILNLCVGEFTSFHMMMIGGIVLSALYTVYLFFLYRFTKPQEEDEK